jgi:hypothetical protein
MPDAQTWIGESAEAPRVPALTWRRSAPQCRPRPSRLRQILTSSKVSGMARIRREASAAAAKAQANSVSGMVRHARQGAAGV